MLKESTVQDSEMRETMIWEIVPTIIEILKRMKCANTHSFQYQMMLNDFPCEVQLDASLFRAWARVHV